MKLITSLRKLICEECANYSREFCGDDNYCAYIDNTCKFHSKGNVDKKLCRCTYLETALLPADENKAISAIYYAELEAQAAGDKLSRKHIALLNRENKGKQKKCQRCGYDFKFSNVRQNYCDQCKKIIIREKNRQRQLNKKNQKIYS